MKKNPRNKAACQSEAFLTWAGRSAIPLPASHEEPLSEDTQTALDRMLEGKRFVFLGEPDHCIVEKYLFRLTLIRHLFARKWRHVGMETGRSVGWRVDRYLETGDTSHLHIGIGPPSPQDAAIHGRMLEFIDRHENPFHEQLHQISESRGQGTPRLHYWGYDLDLGMPLGAVAPIQSLLEEHAGNGPVREILDSVGTLTDLSIDQQSARVEAAQATLTEHARAFKETLGDETFTELRSWLGFLHDSVAAEKRPRMNQDRRGHWGWRAERERSMMRYLDEIVEALDRDDKLVLLGHNGHLSKDASHLCFHPQPNTLWGWRSWLCALGLRMFSRLSRYPMNMDSSVGTHLHARFPGQVLSIWMLYGQGTLMMPAGPRTVRLPGDTIESLLAQAGDRFLLPLNDADPQAKAILSNANFRLSWGSYASADLTAQADAVYFVRDVNAE